jgi:hypothetical protein
MRVSVLLFTTFVSLLGADLPTRAEQASGPADAAAPTPRAKTCGESFSRSSTEEFNKKCIALAGPLAAMRGEILTIRMDNGSRKTFDNKNSDGASASAFGYGLADFYPDTHIFVVCDYGPDSGHSLAIDGRTGRQLDFGYTFPQFSPDGNWVLTIEHSGEDETDSNFAILDVQDELPVPVWRSKTSKTHLPAKADFVSWDNNRTIRLASPGRKPVFLIQADDGWGRWSISTAPAR